MADTSIKISLELADAAAQKALSDFISKSGAADKSLNKLKNSGSSTFDQLTVSIGKSLGVFDIFAGNLAANLVVKGLEALTGAASALFDTFIVDGVKAAIEAEEAMNSLNVAMAQSGVYSEKASEDFKEFAEQLQATTTVEDDLIIKNAALLQSLGNLDVNGLKRATQASLNLSAALGKDLSTTTEALGKAANGNVTSLQRMGLTIQKGTTDAETFANALRAIEERFEGAAASKVNTYAGAIAQASNNFNDLQENIGNVIVQNPAIIAGINQVSKMFADFSNIADDNGAALREGVAVAFLTVIELSAALVEVFDFILRGAQLMFDGLRVSFNGIATVVTGLASIFSDTAAKAFEEYRVAAIQAADDVKNAFEKDTALGTIGAAIRQVGTAAEEGWGKLQTGANSSANSLENAKRGIQSTGDEAQKSKDRLKAFAEELVKAGESGKTSGELQIEQARAKSEAELAILEKQLADKEIVETEYITRKAALEAQVEATRVAQLDAQYAADQARLKLALDEKQVSQANYIKAKEQLDNQHRKDELKAETDQKKKQLAIDLSLQKARDQQRQLVLQGTSEMFGGLAALAATGGKKMFEITRAFNLAEAVTSGILAVQKAAASAPPPFNIPAIIGASAFAAANVIRITQTKAPSFEDGGIVPGSSYSGDRVQANVNSGEMILNRSQQASLFKMANGGGGSGLEAKLDTLIGLIGSKDDSVVVNIGGRTIVETLRSELASGRTFA